MKQSMFNILDNKPLTDNVFELILQGDTSAITKPGQFVNIKLDGLFLRRPISVCDRNDDKITLIYKVVGKGTQKLSQMKNGVLDLLVGLGNGYDLTKSGDCPVLIGGGAGVPPLYLLCKDLIAQEKKVTVVLGFNTVDEVFYRDAFSKLGAEVIVTTVDGSFGQKGYVTDALKSLDYSYIYTCGPEPMLRAVHRMAKTSGQFSFEERMGCGFGACMGCSCKTVTGYKRICKEGPVLEKEEILWED